MRKLGFLFIAIAIVIGLILPWAQLNFEGKEIATLEFKNFDKEPLSKDQILKNAEKPYKNTVLLRREDNPVRIRFFAQYKVGALLPPIKIPVTVTLKDKDGTLVGAIISFPTRGRGGSLDQPKVRSRTNLEVEIQNDGLHQLQLVFAPNKNDNGIAKPDVESITASFIGNVSSVNQSYKIPAAILALIGFYLIVRSRKRRGGKPKKPRWGREGS